MNQNKHIFEAVASSIRADHPSMRIRYKDESRFMALLGMLVYPFNPRFMEGMTTTIGSNVYFPSLHKVRDNYDNYARVLAHEGVHIYDREQDGFMFFVKYLMPQILFVIPLLLLLAFGGWKAIATLFGGLAVSYLALGIAKTATDSMTYRLGVFFAAFAVTVVSFVAVAIVTAGWAAVLAVLSILCLAPWPAKWRAEYEYRGYSMGIAISHWKYGHYDNKFVTARAKTFTGFGYYRMVAREVDALNRLFAIRASVENGSLMKGPRSRPYQRTYEVYRNLGLVMSKVSNA